MKGLIVLAAVAVLAGCATTGQVSRAPVQNSFDIPSSYNSVWKATVAVFAERSLPVKAIEKDSGLITSDFVIFAQGLFAEDQIKAVADRPSVFLGTWNSGRYTISVYAQEVDANTTRVKITPHIEAFENNSSHTWYVCRSNGSIEKDIHEAILSKLK